MRNKFVLTSLLYLFLQHAGTARQPDHVAQGDTIPPCPLTYNFVSPTDDFTNATGYYEASQSIEASNLISGASTITYDAGVYVKLKPGFKAQTSAYFKALIDGCLVVGTEETADEQSTLRIVPNPNAGHFTLELSEPAAPHAQFRIIDLTGRVLLEMSIGVGNTRQPVLAGDLPDGLYLLQVLSQGKVIMTKKFVKQ